MRQFELCAIENPEVHLHPGTQVKIAELLISEAKIGKCQIVETHSDVVVMRVMRAILEEDISEKYVEIQFTHLAPSDNEPALSSCMNPARIDTTTGIVANWPEGFMDTSQQEMLKMLDAIYGRRRDDAEGEE